MFSRSRLGDRIRTWPDLDRRVYGFELFGRQSETINGEVARTARAVLLFLLDLEACH